MKNDFKSNKLLKIYCGTIEVENVKPVFPHALLTKLFCTYYCTILSLFGLKLLFPSFYEFSRELKHVAAIKLLLHHENVKFLLRKSTEFL